MWDKVLFGFDAEEETVNFGTRSMAVCNNLIFETNTLGVIMNENEEDHSVNSLSVKLAKCVGSKSGKLVVVGECVIVFDDECTELWNHYSFNSSIDCFTTVENKVSGGHSLIFVGLSNGELYCVPSESNGQNLLLGSFQRKQSNTVFSKIYLESVDEACELLIITASGDFYCIKNLELTKLEEACCSSDTHSVTNLLSSITVRHMFSALNQAAVENGTSYVISSVKFRRAGVTLLLLLVKINERFELQLWSPRDGFVDSACFPSCLELQKVEANQDGSLLIGLTTNGSLLVICPYTLLPILHWTNTVITDFVVTNDEETSLLIFTKHPKCQFQLIVIPGFQIKFELDVNCVSFLPSSHSYFDELMFIEAYNKVDDVVRSEIELKKLNMLHIKRVSESNPEYRLERILKRGKFDEAEHFAKLFNLNIEIVYKAQTQKVMSDLQPWTESVLSLKESGEKLKNLLHNIQDAEFIGNCALNVITSDFVLTKELLLYSEERIKSALNITENSSKLTDLLRQIRNTVLCLNTFTIISERPLTAEKWLSFCKADLLNECQLRLKQGEIDEAVLIWTRHMCRLKKQITLEQCVHCLRIVPPWVTSVQLLEWLQVFVPVCLSLFPEMLSNIIVWCNEKLNLMQLRSESGWPECAIHFLKKLLKIIRAETRPDESKFLQAIHLESSSTYFKDILYKIKILTDISEIKRQFGITVSISEYTKNASQDVVFAILDKVPSDILQDFISGFLEKYMLQHNLNSDLVISEYVQCLVDGSVDWWYWEEAPWENRAAVLVKCIQNLEEQMKCVLCVLKHAPVPWSNTICGICEDALNSKQNEFTVQIREQEKLVTCKIILKKYNLKHNNFTYAYIRRVLPYIFAENKDTMLQDALKITEIFDECMRIEVYNLYVRHLIEKGGTEKALIFLDDDSLSLNAVKSCCESIILRVHSLSKYDSLADVYAKYVDILDPVRGKLARAISRLRAKEEEVVEIISPNVACQLRHMHYLRTNYNLHVSPCSFNSRSQQVKVLNACLAQILKNVITYSNDLEKACLKIAELASSLNISRAEVYIRFIHICITQSNWTVTSYLIGNLLKFDEFDECVAKRAIFLGMRLLFHYIAASESRLKDLSLESVHDLIIVGLRHCLPLYLRDGVEISNWCKLLVTNKRKKSVLVKNTDLFLNSNNVCIIDSTLTKLLTSYILYLEKNELPPLTPDLDVKMICKLRNATGGSLPELSEMIQSVTEEEQEFIYFRVIVNLHWSLSCRLLIAEPHIDDNAILKQTKTVTKRSVSHLLKRLIGSRQLDIQRGLALLNYFSVNEGSNWISETLRSYRHDFFRLNSVTELGMAYYQQNKCLIQLREIMKIRKQCLWGKKVLEYGIPYKDAFKDTEYDQKQLLLKLMSVPSMTVSVLHRYCRDINFDFQECLKMYLKHIILCWEPEFSVVTKSLSGETEVIVKPTDQKLLAQCREIVALIGNAKELSEILGIHIWDQINYYYYEVFFVLVALLEEKGIKPEKSLFDTYRTIFVFLSSYQRISEPQQYEKDTWFQLYPNTRSLPQISKYRLPCRLLFSSRLVKPGGDPWKIIKYELNISTYTKWFIALDALALDKDMLCTLAINQITTYESLHWDASVEWNIHLRHQKLLVDIKSCVANIKNLEMASASLYFVVNHLPPGADQLAAANLCYLHAMQWLDVEKSEKAQNGFLKVQKKYLSVSCTHILYVNNLGKPEYLQLVLKPSELIHAIYHDAVIFQRNTGDVFTMPDINKAAEEISKLHGMDLVQIKMELLEEWLQPNHFIRDVSLDEGVSVNDIDIHNNTIQSSKMDYENLQRACYILEKDISQFGPYFINIALDQNPDDSKPIAVRLRALHCLYFVMNGDGLQQSVGLDLDQIKTYMKNLMFVSELERLGLAYSLQGFVHCNKVELAQLLIRRGNCSSVSLAFCICQAFDIETPSIWNNMLARMADLVMIQQLLKALPNFSDNYHLLDSKVLEKAWETVLTVPLIKARLPLTVEQEEVIEKCVRLILCCPVIDRIDVSSIKENCVRINRSDLIEKVKLFLF